VTESGAEGRRRGWRLHHRLRAVRRRPAGVVRRPVHHPGQERPPSRDARRTRKGCDRKAATEITMSRQKMGPPAETGPATPGLGSAPPAWQRVVVSVQRCCTVQGSGWGPCWAVMRRDQPCRGVVSAGRRQAGRSKPAGEDHSTLRQDATPQGSADPHRAAAPALQLRRPAPTQFPRPPPAGSGDGRCPDLLFAGDDSGTDRRGGPTSGVRSRPPSSGAPATEGLPLRQLGQRASTFARSTSGTTGFSTNSCTGSHASSRSLLENLPT